MNNSEKFKEISSTSFYCVIPPYRISYCETPFDHDSRFNDISVASPKTCLLNYQLILLFRSFSLLLFLSVCL